MDLSGGETIAITISGIKRIWRLSKIDGKLVKYFDENDNYTQMPYERFIKLLEDGDVTVESQNTII